MPWVGDKFFYTKRLLKLIAENYPCYEGLPLRDLITNPWSIAEYKADFDIALDKLYEGLPHRPGITRHYDYPHWMGVIQTFKAYHSFGKLQRIVIADILGIDDYELEILGFNDVSRLRSYSYYLMCKVLNGG